MSGCTASAVEMAASTRRHFGTYAVYDQIGQGTFGIVYKVKKESGLELSTKTQVPCYALKRIELAVQHESREREMVTREEEILKSAKHHHVVRFVDSFTEDNVVNLVMEYCAGGNLYSYIRNLERKMSEDMFVNFLKQIADGLKYLHKKKVLHRDIKTKNILMTESHLLKISDFGVSRITDVSNPSKHSFRMGTPRYMSPEILRRDEYGQKTDIWSLGCTAYEMAEMHYAFSSEKQKEAVNNILNHRLPSFDDVEYCPQIIELMKCMLHADPEKRPSAKKILKCLLGHECTVLNLVPPSPSSEQSAPSYPVPQGTGEPTTGYGIVLPAARQDTIIKPFEQPRSHLESASIDIQKLLVETLDSSRAVDIVSRVKKWFRDGMTQKDVLEKIPSYLSGDKSERLRLLVVALQGTEQALDALKEAKDNAESSLSGSNDIRD